MKKLRKLLRRFLITYWPWPPYLWRHRNERAKNFKGVVRKLAQSPRPRTSKGWATYKKRYSKVFKAAKLKEDLIDCLTQYPFNRYGWSDFKYWFKYRLQKKHRYHILETGLKPGYHEYSDVIVAAIAGQRFRYIFEEVWKEFQQSKDQLSYDNTPIVSKKYHKTMKDLKEAYDWFVTKRPEIKKQIDNYWHQNSKEFPVKADFPSYLEKKPSKKETQIAKKIDKAEKTILDNDTKYLKIIVENRTYLTTY